MGRLWQIASPTGTTRYLYDGDRLVSEYDGAGNPVRSYVHGPAADEPLVWYEASAGWTRRYLHADHQGSIVAIADDAGNKLAVNAYDEWGIPNAENQGRFGHTGQIWLPELGLWYYKARLYSPTLGRFLQTDPVGYEGGINLYAYVHDDPVDGKDPTGLREPQETPKPEPQTVPRASLQSVVTSIATRTGIVATGLAVAKFLNSITPPSRRTGTFAYRVYGGKAGPRGASWTPFNPSQYKNEESMRQALALPPSWGNTAEKVAVGYIRTDNIEHEGSTGRQMDPATGKIYHGGGPEITVRDSSEVRIVQTEKLTFRENPR
jgi:RHS repeat-associated protein